MPQTKFPFIRHRIIDRLLNHRSRVSTREMKNEIEREMNMYVSMRTIQGDIEYMRSDDGYGAPIASEKKAYYYTEPFSIREIQLSEEELTTLEFAAGIIHQYRDVGIFQHMTDAVQKIKWGIHVSEEVGNRDQLYTQVLPERAPFIERHQLLPAILRAIKEQNKLSLGYQKFGEVEPVKHVFHPYALKEYRHRWYVVGYSELRKAMRTFSLDRVAQLDAQGEPFSLQDDFDVEAHFKYSFGITGGEGDPSTVVLSFDKEQAFYIKTVPIHHSQQIVEETNEKLVISIEVYPTYELFMQILSYGPGVEVLSPLSVIDEVKRLIEDTAKKYLS